MIKKIFLPLIALGLILQSCNGNKKTKLEETKLTPVDSLALRKSIAHSPVLSPEESMEAMEVAEGFEVKLVASEPLVRTPIDLEFDNKGRIWVVEMTGFMPNVAGKSENPHSGKIIILEDNNGDGTADERKLFLDSLKFPRSICLIDDGILVAEPPNLWYYEIKNDKPGKKVLVDEAYTSGGNVEHRANGLLRALDNWIYNANSTKRYKKKGNKWIIDQTHYRGQWGISQDNHGRLYYNNNSTNLKGDYFTPGLGANNKNKRDIAGFGAVIVADNSVYPAGPTPGVNRGYREGVLDDSLRLVHFTAASGPVIYRANLFGKEFKFNAFVAEPAGNLIKRNILNKNGNITKGKQAYDGKEFIASTDERFRPVTMFNGPDGALYFTDMYRGIIQYKAYLTPYLKNEIESRDLTAPLSYGRIYKVVPVGSQPKDQIIPEDPHQLVELLGHPNGWVRDQAQQKLIDGNFTDAIPDLRKALTDTNNTLLVTHALWTLEGLDALKDQEVLALLKNPSWSIRMQALSVLPSVMNKKNYKHYLAALAHRVERNDTLAAPYVAFLAETIKNFNETAAIDLLQKIITKYPNNKYVADAAISSLEGHEKSFLNQLTERSPNTTFAIVKKLKSTIKKIQDAKNQRDLALLQKEYPKGAALFSHICQTCHGKNGNGIESLAPPLNKSEWVTGDKNKLAAIVLFGLSGSVEVDGKVYDKGIMPGIGHDTSISNEDIAQLLNYIRNNWENNADKVSPQKVKEIRKMFKGRTGTFTIAELKELF